MRWFIPMIPGLGCYKCRLWVGGRLSKTIHKTTKAGDPLRLRCFSLQHPVIYLLTYFLNIRLPT